MVREFRDGKEDKDHGYVGAYFIYKDGQIDIKAVRDDQDQLKEIKEVSKEEFDETTARLKAEGQYGVNGQGAYEIYYPQNPDQANNPSAYTYGQGKGLLAGDKQVEYWTYEDYKKFVEEERQRLEALIGSGNKYWQDGKWVEPTKESVAESMKIYEAQLEEIKQGMRLSKTPVKIMDEGDAAVEEGFVLYPPSNAEIVISGQGFED